MDKVPITDNHIHVDHINGEGPVAVAKKFHRAGGDIMIIPNKPSWTVSSTCNLEKAMKLVLKYVHQIKTSTDVHAFAVVGPHPAELSRLLKNGTDLENAEKIMMDALKMAQKIVIDGDAMGMGKLAGPTMRFHLQNWKYITD